MIGLRAGTPEFRSEHVALALTKEHHMGEAWDINENTADSSGKEAGAKAASKPTGDGDADPQQPEPGTDSQVQDWMGQSVDEDSELADELVAEHGEEKAEELFDQQADGEQTQEARHGDSIDPEQGESAYQSSES